MCDLKPLPKQIEEPWWGVSDFISYEVSFKIRTQDINLRSYMHSASIDMRLEIKHEPPAYQTEEVLRFIGGDKWGR